MKHAGAAVRNLWLVARTIFTEALRRREIYVIVLVTVTLLVAAAAGRFFELSKLYKFYQEVALQAMSMATMATTVVLAARQLPREFERRTIYTLLAKPVARWQFLLGKYLGVVLAGWFCLGLFAGVFLVARMFVEMPLGAGLFAQYLYLQMLLVMVLGALAFVLSLLIHVDAAITIAVLLYLLGQVVTNALTELYAYVGMAGKLMLLILNYTVPQPIEFDLTAKIIHQWPPLHAWVLGLATCYALMFILPYIGISLLLFRRKAL